MVRTARNKTERQVIYSRQPTWEQAFAFSGGEKESRLNACAPIWGLHFESLIRTALANRSTGVGPRLVKLAREGDDRV